MCILLAPTQFCVTLPGCYGGTGNSPSEERSMGMKKRVTLLGKSWACLPSSGMLWRMRRKITFSPVSCGLMLTFRWVFNLVGENLLYIIINHQCLIWEDDKTLSSQSIIHEHRAHERSVVFPLSSHLCHTQHVNLSL